MKKTAKRQKGEHKIQVVGLGGVISFGGFGADSDFDDNPVVKTYDYGVEVWIDKVCIQISWDLALVNVEAYDSRTMKPSTTIKPNWQGKRDAGIRVSSLSTEGKDG
jgi:hypothetical protein